MTFWPGSYSSIFWADSCPHVDELWHDVSRPGLAASQPDFRIFRHFGLWQHCNWVSYTYQVVCAEGAPHCRSTQVLVLVLTQSWDGLNGQNRNTKAITERFYTYNTWFRLSRRRSGQQKWNLLVNTEFTFFLTDSVFGIKEEHSCLGRKFCGRYFVVPPVHRFTPAPPQIIHICPFDCLRNQQSLWNKYKTGPLAQKFRAEQFQNDFYTSGDLLYCKFYQHNVDWKRAEMCKDH